MAEETEKAETLAPREWLKRKRAKLLEQSSELVVNIHYAVASMLERWPNPDLDPTHGITEAEFDAAITKAKGY